MGLGVYRCQRKRLASTGFSFARPIPLHAAVVTVEVSSGVG